MYWQAKINLAHSSNIKFKTQPCIIYLFPRTINNNTIHSHNFFSPPSPSSFTATLLCGFSLSSVLSVSGQDFESSKSIGGDDDELQLFLGDGVFGSFSLKSIPSGGGESGTSQFFGGAATSGSGGSGLLTPPSNDLDTNCASLSMDVCVVSITAWPAVAIIGSDGGVGGGDGGDAYSRGGAVADRALLMG